MALAYAKKYLMKANYDYWFKGMVVRRSKMNYNSKGFCKIMTSPFKFSTAPFLSLIACKLLMNFHFVYSINCFSILLEFIP